MKNTEIENLINLDYATEERKARRKGAKSTQEFFTPWIIVEKMLNKIDYETWSNPTKTFIEPCFGNGNFLLGIIYYRINHGIDWKTTLETLYGIELMEDNVIEAKERILNLLNEMEIEYDKDEAMSIMDKQLRCSDFFKWNFEEWREYTEEELHPKKKISKKMK